MSPLTRTQSWRDLAAHAAGAADVRMRDLFAQDSGRGARYTLEAAGLYLDYAKHRVTDQTLALLDNLAQERQLRDWIARMYAGETINNSENRAVLHVALRAETPPPEVRQTLARMREFSHGLLNGTLQSASGERFTDVVNLGIGGSDLGPRMATRALRRYCTGMPHVHFVANVDPEDLNATLVGLRPETTLFIVASKTFTTAETLMNAHRARAWLGQQIPIAAAGRHFAAVSTNIPAAQAFGIAPERVFPMWDWVGGRFSLWSAVGLALMIAIGPHNFDRLLRGARGMDEHFRDAPILKNMPALLGLLGIWYTDFLGARTHAILPYAEDLIHFPSHLQQLEMESNGKRVDRDGRPVDFATAPVVWGSVGTNGQHAFHQLLHQGTHLVPSDFIVVHECADAADIDAHRMLLANALAQSAALMSGRDAPDQSHRHYPGNQPSSTIVMPRLEPESLGALIALYEHKVFVQGAIWGINSFDQWGVELGKTIANTLTPALASGEAPAGIDSSSRNLTGRLHQNPAHSAGHLNGEK